MIIWAGTSNKDVGMVVEHYPSIVFPERDQEIQHVPGRNGDIVLSTGSFQNYEQSYSVFFDSKRYGGLEQVMPKVTGWLLGHEGYQKLEDSYFPDFYRMAYYSGGSEFLSIFNEYGKGTLTFVCAPEKFYKSGSRPMNLSKGIKLKNPSSFKAKPLLYITATSGGKIYFNDAEIEITELTTEMYIDVKKHYAYKILDSGNYMNLNGRIVGKFEDLELGKETTITWNGGITSIKITPYWWSI